MRVSQKLENISERVSQELRFYRLVLAHQATPRMARVILGLAVAYAVSPIDLIPDWFPIIGHLDDLLIVPALVWLGRRLVPPGVIAECRAQARTSL